MPYGRLIVVPPAFGSFPPGGLVIASPIDFQPQTPLSQTPAKTAAHNELFKALAEVDRLKAEVEKKDAMLHRLQDEVEQKNAALQSKAATLQHKDAVIAGNQQYLREGIETIHALHSQLAASQRSGAASANALNSASKHARTALAEAQARVAALTSKPATPPGLDFQPHSWADAQEEVEALFKRVTELESDKEAFKAAMQAELDDLTQRLHAASLGKEALQEKLTCVEKSMRVSSIPITNLESFGAAK